MLKNSFHRILFARWFLLVLLLTCFSISYAQEEESSTCGGTEIKEARKQYEKGIDKKKSSKDERIIALKKALELDPEFAEANFAYALEMIKTIMYKGGNFQPIEPYMLKVIEKCPKYHSDPYYFVGFSYYEQEKWADAEKYLKDFLAFKGDENAYSKDYDSYSYKAKQMIKWAKFYLDIYKNPVPFDPVAVQSICTADDEYLPYISPDNELMLFTRRLPFKSMDRVYQTDQLAEVFSKSERKPDGTFTKGQAMSDPFNKNANEGGATLSIDNKHLFYTICKDEGGTQLNCDIYYTDNVDGWWNEIQKVPGINDPTYSDLQPSIAADGKTLYFASDRKGGIGGLDLYKTVRDASGVWSPPVNLGKVINTPANEKTPFMHSDSETLYFSSDGHPGLGGFDIFYTRKDEKGEWIEPKNIGYPINSEGQDLGFMVSSDGHLGYFTYKRSERTKNQGVGGYDIYSFELYKEARPSEIRFATGVMQTDDGRPLTKAKVEITNARTKERTEAVVDTLTGKYTVVLNVKKRDDFVITVKQDSMAFSSQLISTKDSTNTSKPLKVDLITRPVKSGDAYTLNNIYYESNSASVKAESKAVLDEFAIYMDENQSLKVEIRGHTDNVGKESDNLALSTERAQAIKEYLEAAGVKGERIQFKGYGSSIPIAPNETEQGRAKNRRTEFVIQ